MAKVQWHGERFLRQVKQITKERMNILLLAMEGIAKRKMQEQKNGRTYRRPNVGLRKEGITIKRHKTSGTYKASKPGEYPAVATARLIGSLTGIVQLKPGTSYSIQGKFGTNLKYGLYLELGTSKMVARPWLKPTLEEVKPLGKRLFEGISGGYSNG